MISFIQRFWPTLFWDSFEVLGMPGRYDICLNAMTGLWEAITYLTADVYSFLDICLYICVCAQQRWNYLASFKREVIQQLHGQNFAVFWPPPCVDSFYALSVDNNRHFLTPPHLVHVVIEWPQRGRTGEKKKKKNWRPRRTSGRCACVSYGIMGCQVSKGRMYLYKIK